MCVSPKSGADLVLREGQELKLVYPQEGAEPELFEGLKFDNRFLQPMDGDAVLENTRAATEYCLAHPTWRLSLQTHKIIGITVTMIELFKEFTFEAAHQLAANVDPDHPYANLHGHSFKVEVALRGEPDPATGWIVDLAEVEETLLQVRRRLDHNYLNSIEGLERPTLENLTRWIWDQVAPQLPGLCRVVVRRGTCNEGCCYQGNPS